MSNIKQLLARDETVARVTRSHWITLLPTIVADLAVSVVIVGVSVAGIVLSPPYTWFGLLLLLIPLVHFLSVWWDWRSRVIVVTNRRIIQVAGIVNKRVSDTLLEKVNDIVTRQSGMGQLLGYGDVELISGSDLGADVFHRISDPVGFKKALLEQRAPAGGQPAAGGAEVTAQIRELAELREKGLLTDAEFTRKKRELLERM
jgi:hypothetical protein